MSAGDQGPVLRDRFADLEAALDDAPGRAAEWAALTSAEMRVLPFLPTHLTFREISERLHVSRHTVKSQAIAIYRKLGASSRSEAVERAIVLNLLGD